MLYGHEDPTPAFLDGQDPGAVGAPHDIESLGDDLPLVSHRVAASTPIGREELVFPPEL